MTKLLLWFLPMARGVFPCMLKMKIGSYPDKNIASAETVEAHGWRDVESAVRATNV